MSTNKDPMALAVERAQAQAAAAAAAAAGRPAREVGAQLAVTRAVADAARTVAAEAPPLAKWERVSDESSPDGAAEPGRINLERVAMWRLRVEGGWLYQERMTFSSVKPARMGDGMGKPIKRLSYGRGKPIYVPEDRTSAAVAAMRELTERMAAPGVTVHPEDDEGGLPSGEPSNA